MGWPGVSVWLSDHGIWCLSSWPRIHKQYRFWWLPDLSSSNIPRQEFRLTTRDLKSEWENYHHTCPPNFSPEQSRTRYLKRTSIYTNPSVVILKRTSGENSWSTSLQTGHVSSQLTTVYWGYARDNIIPVSYAGTNTDYCEAKTCFLAFTAHKSNRKVLSDRIKRLFHSISTPFAIHFMHAHTLHRVYSKWLKGEMNSNRFLWF